MAIFSRRDVKHMLDQLRVALNDKQACMLMDQLNVPFAEATSLRAMQDTGRDRRVREALATEWEIAVLYALSRLGQVSYEQRFGDSKPDVHFVHETDGSLNFVAEITSVSDESSEEGKRYQYFIAQFFQFLSKHKLRLGGFRFEIDGQLAGGAKSKRMRLALPPKQRMAEFIESHFRTMVSRVAADPAKSQAKSGREGDVRVTVIYDPRDRSGTSAEYPSHTAPYSLEANPVYGALANKASQLGGAGHRGLKDGIIICDAATTCLRDGAGGANFTLAQIVARFFKQHKSVDFVLVLRTCRMLEFINTKRPAWIERRLFQSPYRTSLSESLLRLLEGLPDQLPRPIEDSFSAFGRLWNATERLGKWFFGGGQMSGARIRVSSRGVHELLAGKISSEKFLAAHGNLMADSLRRTLENGRTIKRVVLEREEHEDDDWLVIEFGNPDPAAAPFRLPRRT
jgi:hypothetical protein